ncbi:hypothetical protein BaRGS_00021477, partial [Batillaria attramentaria]
EGVKELIEDYFAVSNSCEECDFWPEDSDEEEEFGCEDGATPDRSANEDEVSSPDFEDAEIEQPLIRIAGEADSVNGDCNQQGLRDLEAIRGFSCGCKLPCVAEPGDNRSGCIVQFSPEEILAFNLSFKDMERGEKDMMILGLISSCIRNGLMTECRKRKSQTMRQKSRSSFIFNGRHVCHSSFLKLLGISANKVKALQDHYQEHGLEPRKLKSGGRKNNTKALTPDETRQVVRFIHQYAEDHAVHLPGRVPGFKRDDIQLLPSSTPKSRVYRDYMQSAARAGHNRIVSRACFGKLWLQLCPYIVVAKPMTDLCWRCQNNTTRIFRSANLTDEEKNDLLLEQQRHLSQVDAERKYYKDLVEQSRVTVRHLGINDLQQTPPQQS